MNKDFIKSLDKDYEKLFQELMNANDLLKQCWLSGAIAYIQILKERYQKNES